MKEITRDYLIEVRPSGVLRAMINGLHKHSELSQCAIALDGLGELYPRTLDDARIFPDSKPEDGKVREELIGKYCLTPGLACVTWLMESTYPQWVQSVIYQSEIPWHNGYVLMGEGDEPLYNPPVLDSLHWAMYLVSRGSLQFLLNFFNFNLNHTYPKQSLFNIEGFPKFRLDNMKYALNKEWVPQSLIILEIAGILEQFGC